MIHNELSNSAKIDLSNGYSGGGVVDLTGDKDPIDEDGDTRVGDSEVLVSLGEISSGGRKSQESNIGDNDNTRDGGKIVGGEIGTCSGGIAIRSVGRRTGHEGGDGGASW
nr:hypothetical protein [Tanacetum cinerariifolium]